MKKEKRQRVVISLPEKDNLFLTKISNDFGLSRSLIVQSLLGSWRTKYNYDEAPPIKITE